MKKLSYVAFVILLAVMFTTQGFAQEALKPRPSPMSVATLKNGDTYVKVTYGRPHKKQREVFGKLVQYGKVWRTGANEATEITTTEDIKFGENTLKAGTYTLFTVPNEDKWTIVINKDLGQWGAYRHNPDNDLFKFDVPVKSVDTAYEAFTIEFEDNKASKTNLNMIWDKTKVSIPVEVL
ncbi:MAG: DUF2911 domain-containing protein [Bacteroidota bacterium]